jgi:hypothetical protein
LEITKSHFPVNLIPLSHFHPPKKPFRRTFHCIYLPSSLYISSLYCYLNMAVSFSFWNIYHAINLVKLYVGDPSTLNVRKETVLHAVCGADSNPATRASILSTLIQWDRNGCDKVSINQVDVEGNTAIHYAANNGLLSCVEKLVAMGAIISIVNKNNNTCCEMVTLSVVFVHSSATLWRWCLVRRTSLGTSSWPPCWS